MFTVQIDEEEKNQEVQVKQLNAFYMWSLEFDNSDQKKLSETTHFFSEMPQSYRIFCLQSYPRQHMLAKCYIIWNKKKAFNFWFRMKKIK